MYSCYTFMAQDTLILLCAFVSFVTISNCSMHAMDYLKSVKEVQV